MKAVLLLLVMPVLSWCDLAPAEPPQPPLMIEAPPMARPG